jgi:hypothetical protein
VKKKERRNEKNEIIKHTYFNLDRHIEPCGAQEATKLEIYSSNSKLHFCLLSPCLLRLHTQPPLVFQIADFSLSSECLHGDEAQTEKRARRGDTRNSRCTFSGIKLNSINIFYSIFRSFFNF